MKLEAQITLERLARVDLSGVIACIFPALSYFSPPYVRKFKNDEKAILTGACTGSLVSSCMLLMVLNSRVLLQPVPPHRTSFYSRKLKNLELPFVYPIAVFSLSTGLFLIWLMGLDKITRKVVI